ncbi:hypothetical protein WP1_044 [Pseudomonas phage WP1]
MVSDLDEFMLRYEADTARGRAQSGAPPGPGQAREQRIDEWPSGFAPFAGGAATELGRVVPQVDSVTSAVRGMNAQLAVGAIGVALVAAGVRAFINTRTRTVSSASRRWTSASPRHAWKSTR